MRNTQEAFCAISPFSPNSEESPPEEGSTPDLVAPFRVAPDPSYAQNCLSILKTELQATLLSNTG